MTACRVRNGRYRLCQPTADHEPGRTYPGTLWIGHDLGL